MSTKIIFPKTFFYNPLNLNCKKTWSYSSSQVKKFRSFCNKHDLLLIELLQSEDLQNFPQFVLKKKNNCNCITFQYCRKIAFCLNDKQPLPTNCLIVFDHFVGLALKALGPENIWGYSNGIIIWAGLTKFCHLAVYLHMSYFFLLSFVGFHLIFFQFRSCLDILVIVTLNLKNTCISYGFMYFRHKTICFICTTNS